MIKLLRLTQKKDDTTVTEKKNISIAVRLTFVAIGMLLALGVIIITFSSINTGNSIKEREKESLRNTAYTLKNAYYVLYQGNFEKLKEDTELGIDASIENKKQVFDATSSATEEVTDAVSSATVENLNGMTIMETLHEETGIDISIYWGDERIATSFEHAINGRAVGTKLVDEVKRKVIEQSGEYFSEQLIEEGHSHYAYYIPIINENTVLGVICVAKDSELIDNIVTKTVYKLMIFEVIITAIASLGLFMILRRIANYIHEASETLQVIADGDLTIEINHKLLHRKDEIGQLGISMKRLRDDVKEMLNKITQSIVILSSYADELDQSTKKTRLTVDDVVKAMDDISKGALSQAEDTQNANYSIIEVGNEISNISDAVNVLKSRSEDISIASQQADVIADKLEKSANNTMRAIEKIVRQTEETNLAAEEIQKALNVISDIAKRTNLLSLNASIEAARAGEQGKGFGVVAGEIKDLADRSGRSAKEIEDILDKLLEESKKSLEIVGSVKEIINDQKSKLDDTRSQFEVVRNGVDESGSSIESIYDKIMILDSQRKTLLDTIESLSAISEENAASTEETTASATELNETIGMIAEKASELRSMSNSLEQSIKIFKLNE